MDRLEIKEDDGDENWEDDDEAITESCSSEDEKLDENPIKIDSQPDSKPVPSK